MARSELTARLHDQLTEIEMALATATLSEMAVLEALRADVLCRLEDAQRPVPEYFQIAA